MIIGYWNNTVISGYACHIAHTWEMFLALFYIGENRTYLNKIRMNKFQYISNSTLILCLWFTKNISMHIHCHLGIYYPYLHTVEIVVDNSRHRLHDDLDACGIDFVKGKSVLGRREYIDRYRYWHGTAGTSTFVYMYMNGIRFGSTVVFIGKELYRPSYSVI